MDRLSDLLEAASPAVAPADVMDMLRDHYEGTAWDPTDGYASGSPHQTSEYKADTPENAADAIYRGAVRRKPMLVLTTAGKFGYWVSRVAPHLYERIIERKFGGELERE